jgi:hypothetical protein
MKPLIIAAALLLAGPLHAAELPVPRTATDAQWKDIRTFQRAYTRCDGSFGVKNIADADIAKVCKLALKLHDKLADQGFCFYKRFLPGRPAADKQSCEPLTDREP